MSAEPVSAPAVPTGNNDTTANVTMITVNCSVVGECDRTRETR